MREHSLSGACFPENRFRKSVIGTVPGNRTRNEADPPPLTSLTSLSIGQSVSLHFERKEGIPYTCRFFKKKSLVYLKSLKMKSQ